MASELDSKFILLSSLVSKLEDKEYYQTYAKSLLMTNRPEIPIPSDNHLVEEMFKYFIQTNELQAYYKNSRISYDELDNEINRRALAIENNKENDSSVYDLIWKKEIYIKLNELKKLYANKCIVLPNSLLRECIKETI